MSKRRTLWIDHPRCTGCGTCMGVCPVNAIHIVYDKAQIDDEMCTGCGACLDACPENAIQFVLEGEIVPVQAQPVLAVPVSRPVAEAAGATAVVVGTAMLKTATQALAHLVDRWLTRGSATSVAPSERELGTGGSAAGGRAGDRGGQRKRHRRQGR